MNLKKPVRLATGALGALLLILFAFATLAAAEEPAAAYPAADEYYTLDVTIDRLAVPEEVAFSELTLLIDTGGAETVEVSAGGTGAEVEHDPGSGTVMVTTAADAVQLLLKNPADLNAAGTVEKATLKYDRQWAWSHGMDDNQFLRASIQALEDRGWRGTLFIVGRYLNYADQGQNADMLTSVEVRQELEQGWSLGNHSWNHECGVSELVMHQTVISDYNRLRTLIDNSARSGYRVTAFAAPCADDAYIPVVEQIINDNSTNLLFNETQFSDSSGYHNYYRIIVDAGAGEPSSWNTAVFSAEMPIGRDFTIDGHWSEMGDGNYIDTIATIDALVAESGLDRHLWYNSGGHGGEEEAIGRVADHIVANYDPDSADPAWVAPSDQIFNYLLVRDNSVVNVRGPAQVVPAGFDQGSLTWEGDDLRLTFTRADGPGWYEIHRGGDPYFAPSSSTLLASGHDSALNYTDAGVLADRDTVYYVVHTFRPAAEAITEPARVGGFSYRLANGSTARKVQKP